MRLQKAPYLIADVVALLFIAHGNTSFGSLAPIIPYRSCKHYLGEKLISAYNILIGADAETEYNLLAAYNIAQATPGDLRGDLSINSQAIANTYISLGMGKRYADGVTLIGWRL